MVVKTCLSGKPYRSSPSLEARVLKNRRCWRALLREISNLVDLGRKGGMVLHKGEIAKMRIGEGKTLVAILSAYLNRVIEKHAEQLCILAEDCDQADYAKLVKALCADNNVNLITVPSAKTLGEWAGLCKIDFEGKARKVVGCSCIIVKEYGEESEDLHIVQEYVKSPWVTIPLVVFGLKHFSLSTFSKSTSACRDEDYAWGLRQIAKASVVVTQILDWKLHAFDVLSEFDGNN
ncbi:hypothetical protein Sjap_005190 [Stephania japonica]|uniref:40S ribosomal protein S12 n=1 Tax=Stephania japonica TaxID=461633 RepID=A0AAP0K3L6_9MAGN